MASAWPQRSLSALAPMIATPIFFWSILTMNEQAGKTDRRAQKPLQRNWLSLLPRRLEPAGRIDASSEEHTSELQSLMRISYAVFCLKKKTKFLWRRSHKNIPKNLILYDSYPLPSPDH